MDNRLEVIRGEEKGGRRRQMMLAVLVGGWMKEKGRLLLKGQKMNDGKIKYQIE